MKLLSILFSVILSTADAGESTLPESILYEYVVSNAEIKFYIQNMYAQMHSVARETSQFISYIEYNITELRTHYGKPTFDYWKEKYTNIYRQLENHGAVERDCLVMAATTLMENRVMQDELSDSITSCLTYWVEGYAILDKMIIDKRAALLDFEKEAHGCLYVSDRSHDRYSSDCAEKVLQKSWKLSGEIHHDIDNELTSLSKRTNETLGKLYKRLTLKRVFSFYEHENLMDQLFETFCSI